MTTLELLRQRSAAHLGELGWRIGLALAGINVILIGLVVSSVNPRASRSGNQVLALLTFVVYYNLISLGSAWVAQGRVSLPVWITLLHGGVLMIAMTWLAARHQNWQWRRGSVLRPAVCSRESSS